MKVPPRDYLRGENMSRKRRARLKLVLLAGVFLGGSITWEIFAAIGWGSAFHSFAGELLATLVIIPGIIIGTAFLTVVVFYQFESHSRAGS